MKLNDKEVLLLVNSIQVSIDYYTEVATRRTNALLVLQAKLNEYHATTVQLDIDAGLNDADNNDL
jgi:hypothetical protein